MTQLSLQHVITFYAFFIGLSDVCDTRGPRIRLPVGTIVEVLKGNPHKDCLTSVEIDGVEWFGWLHAGDAEELELQAV